MCGHLMEMRAQSKGIVLMQSMFITCHGYNRKHTEVSNIQGQLDV